MQNLNRIPVAVFLGAPGTYNINFNFNFTQTQIEGNQFGNMPQQNFYPALEQYGHGHGQFGGGQCQLQHGIWNYRPDALSSMEESTSSGKSFGGIASESWNYVKPDYQNHCIGGRGGASIGNASLCDAPSSVASTSTSRQGCFDYKKCNIM